MRNGKGGGGGGRGWIPPSVDPTGDNYNSKISQFYNNSPPGTMPSDCPQGPQALGLLPTRPISTGQITYEVQYLHGGKMPWWGVVQIQMFHSWRKSKSVVFVRQKKEETWDKLGNSGIIGRLVGGQFHKVGRTFRTLSRPGFSLSMGASRFQSVHDVVGVLVLSSHLLSEWHLVSFWKNVGQKYHGVGRTRTKWFFSDCRVHVQNSVMCEGLHWN